MRLLNLPSLGVNSAIYLHSLQDPQQLIATLLNQTSFQLRVSGINQPNVHCATW